LNGLALVDGQPRYVTALGETDSAQGWRDAKATGGCLIDVPSGQTVVRGLALPHSPRVHDGHLFFLHSGLGRLDLADPTRSHIDTVAQLPGVVRGLAFHGGFAFVGLSKARPTLEGVPIVVRRDHLQCGLWVVDLRTGATAAHLAFLTGVEEVFDVQVLPDITFPYVSGPGAESDTGQPLWTVPPASQLEPMSTGPQ
jgi:uncharacterized protein (TIGR03032 family)